MQPTLSKTLNPAGEMVQLTLVPTGVDTARRRRLQAVGDVVEGVGDSGLQVLQRRDYHDADEGQDESIFTMPRP